MSAAGRRPARRAGRDDPPPAAAARRDRPRRSASSTACSSTAGRCSASCARPRPASSARSTQIGPFARAGAPGPRPAARRRRRRSGRRTVRSADAGRRACCARFTTQSRPGRQGARRHARQPARPRRRRVPAAASSTTAPRPPSRFDSTSHILPAHAVDGGQCTLAGHGARRGLQRVLPRQPRRPGRAQARASAATATATDRDDAAPAPDAHGAARPRRASTPAPGATAVPQLPAILKPLEDVTTKLRRRPRQGRRGPHRLPPRPMSIPHRQPGQQRHAAHQPGPGRHDDRRRAARRRLPLLQRQQGPAVRHDLPAQREGARRAAARRGLRGPHRRLPRRPGQRDHRRAGRGRHAAVRAAGDEARRRRSQGIPEDTLVRVRPRSLLGAKFVELIPGDAGRGRRRPTRRCRCANARDLARARRDLQHLRQADTREGLQGTIRGFGDAVAARGPDINRSLVAIAELLPPARSASPSCSPTRRPTSTASSRRAAQFSGALGAGRRRPRRPVRQAAP